MGGCISNIAKVKTWKEVLEDGRRRSKWDGSGSVKEWKRKKEGENNKDKKNIRNVYIIS